MNTKQREIPNYTSDGKIEPQHIHTMFFLLLFVTGVSDIKL